tara:strand:+ start:3132 stop:3383 length:252 start_codon:yes stop_codon:yes gene_type:complete
MGDTYTVTQADRDAADKWMNSTPAYGIVTAFARHRTEAITTLQSQLAEARAEVLEEAAKVARPMFCGVTVAHAILALKDTPHE